MRKWFTFLVSTLRHYLAWQIDFPIFNTIIPLLLFLFYFSIFDLQIASCHSLLFILSIIFLVLSLSYLPVITYPQQFRLLGKRGIVCAQARPKWVAVGPVPTPLLKTFGLNTVGGSSAQHCKKGPLHMFCIFYLMLLTISNFYKIFLKENVVIHIEKTLKPSGIDLFCCRRH